MAGLMAVLTAALGNAEPASSMVGRVPGSCRKLSRVAASLNPAVRVSVRVRLRVTVNVVRGAFTQCGPLGLVFESAEEEANGDHHPNPNSRSVGRWASFSRVQRKRPMVTITKETSLMPIDETAEERPMPKHRRKT